MVIWHLTYTGGAPSDADCASLATSFYASLTTATVDYVFSGVTYAGIDVQDLTSDTAGSGSHDGTTLGGGGTTENAAQVALLCSMAIARRYRGGKPRSYWPFGSADDLDSGGLWASSYVSAVQAALETYQSEIIGQTAGTTVIAAHVSVSYYSGFTSVLNPVTGRTKDIPKVRTGSIPIDPIISLAVSNRVATQRRRTGRRR